MASTATCLPPGKQQVMINGQLSTVDTNFGAFVKEVRPEEEVPNPPRLKLSLGMMT